MGFFSLPLSFLPFFSPSLPSFFCRISLCSWLWVPAPPDPLQFPTAGMISENHTQLVFPLRGFKTLCMFSKKTQMTLFISLTGQLLAKDQTRFSDACWTPSTWEAETPGYKFEARLCCLGRLSLTHTQTQTHARTHTQIHKHACTYTHAYIYTHTQPQGKCRVLKNGRAVSPQG